MEFLAEPELHAQGLLWPVNGVTPGHFAGVAEQPRPGAVEGVGAMLKVRVVLEGSHVAG